METNTKIFLVGVLLVAVFVSQFAYAISSEWVISNNGKIDAVGVELYSDEGLSTKLYAISWSPIREGDVKTFNAWLYNSGSVPITCSMNIENFLPDGVDTVLTISWNYAGTTLNPSTSLYVIISLTVAQDAQTFRGSSFSFDIHVSGLESP